VTVVIPFRDRIPWLVEAVESVKAQTLADVELVLVDDGSQEPLPAHVRSDEAIRLIRLEGSGRSVARNAGVSAAAAPYVAFLDADDLFLPEKLERQLDALERSPAAVLCHTSYDRVDVDGNHLETRSAGRFSGSVYPAIVENCPVAMSTVVVRRQALGSQPFTPGIEVGEDLLLWVSLAQRAPFLGIDEPLARIRMHGSNAGLALDAVVAARLRLLPHVSPLVRRRVRASVHLDRALARWSDGASRADIGAELVRAFALRPDPRTARLIARLAGPAGAARFMAPGAIDGPDDPG
jgi:glycosyltransferase involved in cell wall biosynthesis